MSHLHILFIPSRHRSGLFFILVLILLTDIGDVGDDIESPRSVRKALTAATKWYFKAHPHFRPGDHNERKVQNLINTHLEDEQNTIELPCLLGAIEDEPLYRQLQEQQEQTSSEAPPQPSRQTTERCSLL